jgi:hypothetical protein
MLHFTSRDEYYTTVHALADEYRETVREGYVGEIVDAVIASPYVADSGETTVRHNPSVWGDNPPISERLCPYEVIQYSRQTVHMDTTDPTVDARQIATYQLRADLLDSVNGYTPTDED